MVLLPDPDAPIYESVRTSLHPIYDLILTQEEQDEVDRKRAKDAGYALGRGLMRFSQAMRAWSEGLAEAQAEEAESDDTDNSA